MTRSALVRWAASMAILSTLAGAPSLPAQLVGSWTRQPGAADPAGMPSLVMTFEPCCSGGLRVAYRAAGAESGSPVMSLESPLDGTQVPVIAGGKPTGETMGVKRLDDHHLFTVLMLNGKQYGTSKATLSPDGKTLTVENEVTQAGQGYKVGKAMETWVRR